MVQLALGKLHIGCIWASVALVGVFIIREEFSKGSTFMLWNGWLTALFRWFFMCSFLFEVLVRCKVTSLRGGCYSAPKKAEKMAPSLDSYCGHAYLLLL